MANKDWNDIPYVAGDCVKDINGWNDAVTSARLKEADYIVYIEGATIYAVNGATGDIVTSGADASTVIQAALDELAGDGVVYFKPGTYDIITSLTVDAGEHNVSFVGSGGGPYGDSGATIFTIGAATPAVHIEGVSGTRCYSPMIKDIHFTNDDGRAAPAILIEYATTANIIRCGFTNIDEEAIKVTTCFGINILECNFSNCGDIGNTKNTILLQSSGGDDTTTPVIANCIFEADNYCTVNYNKMHMKVYENFFEGDSTTKPSAGFIDGNYSRSTIIGNTFIDAHATPTFTCVEVNGAYNVISNNQIRGGRYGISLPGAGNSDACVIANNSLTSQYNQAILLQAARPSTIIGNVISYAGHGSGYGGILCTTEHFIIGNEFVDCNYDGIKLSGATGAIIRDNWIHEEHASGVMNRCIRGAAGSDNNFVINNVLQDSTIILSNLGAATIVRDNDGYGGVLTTAANYTAHSFEMILVNAVGGAITITLPASHENGHTITIKKIDASVNNVVIDGNGGDTIDGALTYTIMNQWESVTIVSDGTNWYII